MSLQTEFDFTLPKGFIDKSGMVHTQGVMRLATARDEIEPLRDPRVRSNDAYLPLIILSRVVVRIGPVDDLNPNDVEGMFAADLAYLQDLYERINFGDAEAENTSPFAETARGLVA